MAELSKASNVVQKNGVGTLWPNLNRLCRLVPCGKRDFDQVERKRGSEVSTDAA